MCDKKIITHCAPTLAGIKTANLFSESYLNKDALLEEIKAFNLAFKTKGVKMVPIQFKNNRALIYVFRIKLLANDLKDSLSTKILKSYGYESLSPFKAINHLRDRLKDSDTFPHEIGLFLGYPPEDVKGFILNKAKNSKLCGYWKVYGDAKKAENIFLKYRKCSRVYKECYEKGFPFQKLIVNNY